MPFCKRKALSTLEKVCKQTELLHYTEFRYWHWLQLNPEAPSITDVEFGVERTSCTSPELLKNNIPLLHQTGALNQQLVKPLLFKT